MASSDFLIGAALAGLAAGVSPTLAERFRPKRTFDTFRSVAGDPGYRTHYRWLGPEDGPIAVCIHGLTTPSFVWEAFAPVLVRHGYRVLLYDLFGRGLSDTPKGLQSGAYFGVQLDHLIDTLGVTDPVLLCGYSMGGAIAATYAATRSERIHRLILIAPAGFGHDLGRVPGLAIQFPVLGGALMRLAYPVSARRALETDRDRPFAVENMVDRQIAETKWRGFAPVVWSSIRGILDEDLAPSHRRIGELGIPALAVWGAEDEVIPLKGMEGLKACNPNAENVVIAGAGHAIPYSHVSDLERASMRLLA
ncbi:MAG: alpha/beta hydrolase [Pseudomonadota bacterium]